MCIPQSSVRSRTTDLSTSVVFPTPRPGPALFCSVLHPCSHVLQSHVQALERSAVPRLSKRAQKAAKRLARKQKKAGKKPRAAIGPTATLTEFYTRGGEALMRQTVVILIGIASGGAAGVHAAAAGTEDTPAGDLMSALRPNAAGRQESGESVAGAASGGGGALARVQASARARTGSRGLSVVPCRPSQCLSVAASM